MQDTQWTSVGYFHFYTDTHFEPTENWEPGNDDMGEKKRNVMQCSSSSGSFVWCVRETLNVWVMFWIRSMISFPGGLFV